MSRAFVREPDSDAVEDLPDRPVSDHANYVTPRGLGLIEGELARLQREGAFAHARHDRAMQARVTRDLRYWSARRASAQVIPPLADPDEVQFGTQVTLIRDDGRRQVFRIVGEDEADPAQGTLSHVSPLARALFGRTSGDVVKFGPGEIEIVSVG